MNLDRALVEQQADIAVIVSRFIRLTLHKADLVGLCPFHAEKTPSFKVNVPGQFFKCFGCGVYGDVFEFIQKLESLTFDAAISRVAELAGLSEEACRVDEGVSQKDVDVIMAAKPQVVAEYVYSDEAGASLYTVKRWEPGFNGRRKDFTQAGEGRSDMKGVRRVLYRLPSVLAADRVLVAEGEKCVHALESLGYTATTQSGGSNAAWEPYFSEWLRGKQVVIFPDSDITGMKLGKSVTAALHGIAASIIFVPMPDGYNDIADYILAGHDAAEIERLITEAKPKPTGLRTLREIREEVGLNALFEPEKAEPPIPTPWPRLNDIIGGWRKATLNLIAARPSIGKTAFAGQIAHYAASQGHGVAFFELEMRHVDLLHRFIAWLAKIPFSYFMSREKNPEERRRIQETWAGLEEIPLLIDDGTGTSVNTAIADIKAKREAGHKIDLIVFDYLGLAKSDEKAENRTREIGKISGALKCAAKDLEIPIVVLCQLNRVGERDGVEPQLSHLRESGDLEQDADIVIFIHRKEKGYLLECVPTDLIVAKQRQGPQGYVSMIFVKSSVRLEQQEMENIAA